MSEHTHLHRTADGNQDDPAGEALDHAQVQINTQGTDDLLDEIDGLLEDNAEEFVNSYVQKGGQ
ncbi:ubiquitin-like protein Pup [Corynebacterium sp. zg-331]|uniref:ubiquitin-like protein Pup n=1 Tax=unclassified Corynebacterium TaxID=2624378 RepID=UPI00128DD1D5|nr:MULTISPECIES: ubiquitin-like protein Pup [unclassified Corynebacterium]MBC3185566.1 ubiquitin-like protein Pup [Corynebacterium sp. zg-331]MPV52060.1 ubiquitin-like protein Pup [Corynebacterium sp. zg331]